ncbi:MAG: OmpH family outer membrane protein [Chitinophagaceae bacterium]|nr:OmpH family outer membrane protein [Chitinophagaceae bacterium]
MKKVLTLCFVFAASFLISNNLKAQQVKIGFFDEQAVLALMPGIGKVDTLLQTYVSDSLNPRRDYILSELKRKDSTLRADSAIGKLTPQVKDIMQKEMSQDFYTIQNWQQIQQEAIQTKQDQLLLPFRQKVYGVLQDIIKDQKYTHVFKPTEVIYAEKSDDIALRVLAGLKIPLPKEVADAIKEAGISSTPAPVKPAAPKK